MKKSHRKSPSKTESGAAHTVMQATFTVLFVKGVPRYPIFLDHSEKLAADLEENSIALTTKS